MEPALAAERLREALALWRGPALADLAGEPAHAAAAHLDESAPRGAGGAHRRRSRARPPRRRRARARGARGRAPVPRAALGAARARALPLGPPGATRSRRTPAPAARSSTSSAPSRAPSSRSCTAASSGRTRTLALRRRRSRAARAAARSRAPRRARRSPCSSPRRRAATRPPTPRRGARRCDASRETAARAIERHGGTLRAAPAERRIVGRLRRPASRTRTTRFAPCAPPSSCAAPRRVGGVGIATGEVITGSPAAGQALVSGPPLELADRLRGSAGADAIVASERTWRLVRHAVARHGVGRRLPARPRRRRGAGRSCAISRPRSSGARTSWREIVPRVRAREPGAPAAAPHRLRRAGDRQDATRRRGCGAARRRGDGAHRPVLRLRRGDVRAATRGRRDDRAARPAKRRSRELLAARASGRARRGDARRGGSRHRLGRRARRGDGVGRAAPAGDARAAATGCARARGRPLGGARPARPRRARRRRRPRAAARALPRATGPARHPAPVGRRQAQQLVDPSSTRSRPARQSCSLAELSPGEALGADERARIVGLAEGNPLYIEQLLAATLEDATEAVPDSIHALLAARLDGLPAEERAVLEAAAACGATFSAAAVGELVGRDARQPLESLVRRDLLRPADAPLFGEETWAFRHALIQDAAYRSMPKRRRAAFHEAYAGRVARLAEERGIELDELVGYHLEQTVRLREEVGDAGPAALARWRARPRAGWRRPACARTSATTWRRARRSCGAPWRSSRRDDPERDEALLTLAEGSIWTRRRSEAAAAPRGGAGVGRAPRRRPLLARVTISEHDVAIWRDVAADRRSACSQDLDWAIAVLEEAGDDRGAGRGLPAAVPRARPYAGLLPAAGRARPRTPPCQAVRARRTSRAGRCRGSASRCRSANSRCSGQSPRANEILETAPELARPRRRRSARSASCARCRASSRRHAGSQHEVVADPRRARPPPGAGSAHDRARRDRDPWPATSPPPRRFLRDGLRAPARVRRPAFDRERRLAARARPRAHRTRRGG